MDLLARQVDKLRRLSESIESWNTGPYAKYLRFCDQSTYDDFVYILGLYHSALKAKSTPKYVQSFRSSLERSQTLLATKVGDHGLMISAVRSACPASIEALKDAALLDRLHKRYWKTEFLSNQTDAQVLPNPLFATALSPNSVLHYATDLLLGFHLATAYMPLTETSPLHVNSKLSTFDKVIETVMVQFCDWTKGFKAIKDRLIIRFVTADALAFCHTLQYRLDVGAEGRTARIFRRQFDLLTTNRARFP
jgi:hypothetical protein